MKAKKLIGLLLAATMVFSVVGCGQKDQEKESTSVSSEKVESTQQTSESSEVKEEPKDPITLEWWYRGNGIQKDTQAVEDRINELLKEAEGLEHVTISLNPFISSDYANSVLLAQTSGEQIDILGSVSLNYVNEVRNGTYLDITEYLESDQFADLKATFPQWLWEAVDVDGGIYMVPNFQRSANRSVLKVPNNYIDCIDMERMEELMAKGIETQAELEEYASIMKEAVLNVRKKDNTDKAYITAIPGMFANTSPANGQGGYYKMVDTVANGGFVIYDGETEIKNVYLSDLYKAACEIQAGWYEEGLVSKDILVTGEGKFPFFAYNEAGYIPISGDQQAALGGGTMPSTRKNVESTDILWFENNFMVNNWGAGGNGVTSTCENPEEALMFLSLLNTGSELGNEIYNTVVFGLEGVHYEKIDDKHIKTLEYDGSQAGADVSYAAHMWIMGNTFNAYQNQAVSDEQYAAGVAIANDENAITSPVMGFRLDQTPIETEIGQCKAVVDEYKDVLKWGLKGKDWEAYYNEFVKKLEAAGCQKVIDEIQAQYDAWRNAK